MVPSARPAPLPKWIVHAGFGLLGGLALYFTRERLFADAAHYLIHVVDSRWFRVEHQRLVLALAQLPSLLAVWLDLSMYAVLVVHTLGHVLLAWLLAWRLQHTGDQDLAIGLLMLQFMGQQWLFFSPQYEIGYGAWMAFPLLAIWRKNPIPTGWSLVLWSVLVLLLLTSHPEHVVTYAVVAVLALRGERWTRSVWTLMVIPIAVLFLAKVFFLSPYEQGKFASGLSGDPRFLDPNYWVGVTRMVAEAYPLVLLLGIGTLVGSLRSRERILPFLLVLSTTVLAVAVSLVADGSQFTRNTSSAYFPLVTILVLCGCVFWWKGTTNRAVLGVVVILLLLGSTLGIVQQGMLLKQRTAMIQSFCAECLAAGSSKCRIGASDGPALYGTWEWSLPMEAMLISKARLGSTVNLITSEDIAFDSSYVHLADDMILFRRWEPRHVDRFSMGYFSDLREGAYHDIGDRR